MAKFVLILFALVLIEASYALKCNYCNNQDCTSFKVESCTTAGAEVNSGCLTEISRDKTSLKETKTLKCVFWPKTNKKHECVPAPNQEILKCDTCTDDLCNSATSIASFGIVTVMATIVALALPRFV